MSIDAWQWYRSKQRKPNPKTSLSTARDVVSARAKKRNPFQAYVDPSRPSHCHRIFHVLLRPWPRHFFEMRGGNSRGQPTSARTHAPHFARRRRKRDCETRFHLEKRRAWTTKSIVEKSLVVRASGGRQYPSSRSNAFANMILNRKSSRGGVGRHPKTRRGRAIWGVYLFRILLRLNPP